MPDLLIEPAGDFFYSCNDLVSMIRLTFIIIHEILFILSINGMMLL